MFGRRSSAPPALERSFALDDPRHRFAAGLDGVTFTPSAEAVVSYCAGCRERLPIIEPLLMRTPIGVEAIIGRCATCRRPLSKVLTPAKALMLPAPTRTNPSTTRGQQNDRKR